MTRSPLLTCLCLVMLATAGTADDDLQSKVKAFFQKFDANQDGTVTPDEFPNDRIFKRLDTSGDGKITESDFGSNTEKPEKTDKPDKPDKPMPRADKPDGHHGGWFKRLDRNGDGKLTRDEMRGHEGLFHQLDTNNNNELDQAEADKISKQQRRKLHGTGGDEMDGSRGDKFDKGDRKRRGKRGGKKGWQRMMEHADTNGDGKLSEKEWIAMQRDQFNRMDSNGDGSLSAEEIKAHMESRKRGRKGKDGQRGSRENKRGGDSKQQAKLAKRIFQRMDRNGDGSISKDEAPDRMPFDQVDSDGDGKVSEAEFTKAWLAHAKQRGGQGRNGSRGQDGEKKDMDRRGGQRGGDRAAAFFKRMDKNGDGKITKDEAPERLKRAFDRIDTDGDGSITQEELSKAFKRGRQKRDRDN
ncbi:EF-hand domain-containing protein [bacterium AH-315-M10]|nr:EF-hand domain-containing protein [bacterium AH-315-M10]